MHYRSLNEQPESHSATINKARAQQGHFLPGYNQQDVERMFRLMVSHVPGLEMTSTPRSSL